MNKNRKISNIINVFQYDETTGNVGINGVPVSGYAAYLHTSVSDGSLGLDSSASINALYLLKNGTKNFEISYDTSGTAKIFRLLPYQTGSFFEIGNPSNAATDYVFISESTYGNVLIGPGIGNGVSNLTGATAATHKIQLNGAVWASSSIQATSFILTGGASTGFLKADGTVDSSTYATQTYLSTQLGSYVTLSGQQTISGIKTFSNEQLFGNGITLTGGYITYRSGSYNLTLNTNILTANRNVFLKDGSGTLAFTTDIPSLAGYATEAYVGTAISNLVASAPATLDTLNELAAALGNDASFATTTATSLGNRLRIDIGTQGLTSTQQGYGRTNLGLGSLATLSSIGNGYITDLAYSKLTGVPSTFAPSAHTHVWTDITDRPTNLSAFTNGPGYITGITSGNVTTALGYTPYNSTNPSGYITGITSGMVTTALGFTPYNSTNPSGYITSSASITGTSAGVSVTLTGTSAANLLYAAIADNDFARIRVGGDASNAGWMEIATADDGTEPIYVRQYTGVFSSLTRTATLLDGSGNTSFPGTVTAPTFSGALSGNASSASSVAWTNVSGRPTNVSSFSNDSGYITSSYVSWGNISSRPSWMTSASLVATHSNANDWQNSGFYENGGGGSNWPSATWYNSINVRHSNQGNYHGFQVAMSYYDNLLWFRSYQGSGTFQSWVYAISSANIGSQSVSYASSAGSASSATSASYANYLSTNYVGGVQGNPQVYFNNGIGVKVAMTGAWSTWSDTLWINGYSGGDVPYMCALHTLRNGSPRMAISVQSATSTGYGTMYEFITSYNIASQTVANTNSISSATGGSYTWTAQNQFLTNNGGSAVNNSNSPALQAYSTGNNSAFMSFHRGGYYAVNFGLDNDNYMRIGGWSAAANRFQLNLASGDLTVSGFIRSSQNVYVDNNYGCSVIGVYSATRYQGVWSMGAAYVLPLDGTTSGNLYGLAWSHPNAGGQAGYLSTHGLLIMENGTTNTALANGIWTRGDVTAYSDARVKDNIELITDAVEKVKAIRGVTFTRNDRDDKTKRFAGVIAQEVLPVLPEVVTEDALGTYSVAYGNLNALLIEAIKEQQKEIDTLKTLINGLTK